MQVLDTSPWFGAAATFLIAAVGVPAALPVVRLLAHRLGAIDHPGGRRVHLHPVPRLGGLAVMFGFVAGIAVVLGPPGSTLLQDPDWSGWLTLGAVVACLLLLGARDDVRSLSASAKLGVELAAAVVVVAVFPVRAIDLGVFVLPALLAPLAAAVAVVFIAGVTNAYNMIDGVDGLAAGVGAIAAAALAVGAWLFGNPVPAVALLALSGALAGFLSVNAQPARIFMGDAGSLPVGFLLGALGVIGFSNGGTWHAVPVAVALGVPLLDLMAAVARRLLAALEVVRHDHLRERFELLVPKAPRVFAPDGPHIHHRLLALGLGTRRAVLVMYGLSAAFAVLSIETGRDGRYVLAIFVLVAIGLALVASRALYDEFQLLRRGLLLPLFETRFVRSRATHAVFDALAFGGAYVASRLAFAGAGSGAVFGTAELMVVGALAAAAGVLVFRATGIYRLAVRRAGTWTLIHLTSSVLLAVVIGGGVAEVLVLRSVVSWPALLLGGYLAWTAVVGVRYSHRILDVLYNRACEGGQRTVLFGAGRGGLAVLREIMENPTVDLRPIAFVDDDPYMWNKSIEGLPVYPGAGRLSVSLRRLSADVVVLASSKLSPDREAEVRASCRDLGICVSRATIALEAPVVRPIAAANAD
jgi:UDP-GlcNAc:undecaprenyl-phosphate/decaprenyl-phosphate GlcNAc-1-phosphate transferase